MALAVVLTGPIAKQVGSVIGLGDTAVTVWDIAKWPVLLLIVSFMFAILYWAAPNVTAPGVPLGEPGGCVAVLLWIVASARVRLLRRRTSPRTTRPTAALGGVIVFLVWLWITNVVDPAGRRVQRRDRARPADPGRPPGSRRSRSCPRATPRGRRPKSIPPKAGREAHMPTAEQVREWRGANLVDRDGNKIGTIDEIYLDSQSNEPEWALVNTGLFGTKSTFVPIRDASREGDDLSGAGGEGPCQGRSQHRSRRSALPAGGG